MFKKYIEEELRILNLTDLTEYGKGSLEAINYIEELLNENNEKNIIENEIRLKIECLKNKSDDYFKGQLQTYRYSYFKFLVSIGFLEDNIYSE